MFHASDVDELYDLATDPHELTNLAAAPAHADRLRLSAWMADHQDPLRPLFRHLCRLDG